MTEKLSVRSVLYYGAITSCWLHFVAFLMISRTFEYRQVILGVAAVLLAGMFFVLHSTKRTLPIEEQLPSWFYKFGYISWSVGALLWFIAGDIAP